MKEKRALVASDDCGVDAPGAAALLARQKIVHDELRAYREELETLRASADRLQTAGIHTLQVIYLLSHYNIQIYLPIYKKVHFII